MPCYDSRSAPENIRAEFTPLLCSACRALERLGYDFDENPALSVWWHKHKAEDAAREEAEAKAAARKAYRAAAVKAILAKPLANVTAAERRLLQEEGLL